MFGNQNSIDKCLILRLKAKGDWRLFVQLYIGYFTHFMLSLFLAKMMVHLPLSFSPQIMWDLTGEFNRINICSVHYSKCEIMFTDIHIDTSWTCFYYVLVG